MRAYEILKEGYECWNCKDQGHYWDPYATYEGGAWKDCEYCQEKEELEEIKVTKTLAQKRTTPSKDLATKKKMTQRKTDKQGNVKKDATKPMNRNVHDLANITLKGEYRS